MIWFWIAAAGWAAVLALFIERGRLLKLLRESNDNVEKAVKGWEKRLLILMKPRRVSRKPWR